MNTTFLEELIEETQNRGGGLILNLQDKPSAVVLSIEKYNQLISPLANKQADEISYQPQSLTKNSEIKKEKILVTGGAGYIGAHTTKLLLQAGYEVVILDNLSCGRRENIPHEARFVEGDLADTNLLRDLFALEKFDCVMHFAASIEVEESVSNPEKYLKNNTLNTANLLLVMQEAGVNKIIFSSTAAVYGQQEQMPISETAPLRPGNPYGYSKLLAEKIIKYHCKYSGLNAIVFRYFNACGAGFGNEIISAHQSHLMPKILEVAKGYKPFLNVFGNDYHTPDGTCVRDYVHVMDIAEAHLLGMRNLKNTTGFEVFNIGTGKGFSVLEMVSCASEVFAKIIPMEIKERRAGDAPVTVADNSKISEVLGFVPRHSSLTNIISSSWGEEV